MGKGLRSHSPPVLFSFLFYFTGDQPEDTNSTKKNQSTMTQQADETVDKSSLMSGMRTHFPNGFLHQLWAA